MKQDYNWVMETFHQQAGPVAPPSISGHDAVRCLGSGAQGQVWLMKPHNGSGTVAAKFLGLGGDRPPEDTNPHFSRHNDSQVTHEWRVLTQFHHDHLMGVHGLVQDADGGQVLIMDFAAAGSLSQILQARGALSVGETVTVLTPIGQVLAFLHGRGAVHGDVSPGNILFSAAGKPVLSDFGLGRLLGQEAELASGTPGFRCPQDVSRDEAGDVYALAAVGWFALTGRIAPPTRDRPPLGALVGAVPSELVAALEAGLAEDPAQRPTAAAFAQAIFRSARAEAVALGNAVHPSVLPLLPTYHEQAARGRRRARPALMAGRLRERQDRRRSAPGVGWWHRFLGVFARTGPARLDSLWDGGRTVQGPARRRGVALILAGAGFVAALFVLGLMVLGGGWGGFSGPGGGPEPPGGLAARLDPAADMTWAAALPPEIQSGVAATEPVTALHALAWLRSFALANADQGFLEHINVAGSPALAADVAVAHELVERGHTLTGFSTSIVKARTVSSRAAPGAAGGTAGVGGRANPAAGGTAVVRATVLTGSFAEQDGAGALVHRQIAEQSQDLDFVMVQVGERWRIQQILAVENK